MDGPVTVKLRKPIQFGSQVIEELTFRPVTAKDLRRLPVLDGFSMDTVLVLAGRLSGQADPVIDKLTGSDLEEVIDLVSGFMPRSRKGGNEPSDS
jgi:hypothetical protein